ncbi:antigen peptide transporter 2a [Alosa sapidissima]|uniref:antigen peptide transporter 2a n=1 Tax=Alosa sapidissima TaxID=34773 RepID=UPI001C08D994|nr:antigen peptide transporter 2a [Alosa sapidissima]
MYSIIVYVLVISVDLVTFCVLSDRLLSLGSGQQNATVYLCLQWVTSGIRWVMLSGVTYWANHGSNVVLKRWLGTLCFLGSVFESGCFILSSSYPLGTSWRWLSHFIAATSACLLWEFSFPDKKVESNGKQKTQKAREHLQRVILLYRPDYMLLIGAFISLTLAVLCEMFIPFYTGRVIDILQSQYQWSDFLTAILLMGLFSLGSSISAGCRGGLFMCAINSFTSRVRIMLFRALVNQEIAFYETAKTGDLTARLSGDTTLMARAVALNVNVILRRSIKTLGMLSLMLSLSWKLTLLMLMETPLTGLLQNVYDTFYQKLSKEVQDSIARANDAAEETVSGIRTVRGFNTETRESRRYNNCLMDTHNLKNRRDTVRAVYTVVQRITELGMKVAMLLYGRLIIESGQMSTGNLVSFILYQTDLTTNIRALIYIFGDMLNSVGAAGKVFEYLDRKPEVSAEGTLQPDSLKGHVLFQNLTFSYPTRRDQKVLKDFSLELKPGQMTALVGASGGGKTTCVSLLERFYQAQEGEILLDRHPLQNYQHKYLHRKIAMVGQEPVLFSGSVRDNIAYGLGECSLQRIQEAALKANAHGFISQLEKGYDTDVGERGGLLSGGQKQRIAIARALIREPQVLILDEVTSCLDTESEQMVQQTLASCPNQTLLVIAHRLKTIERADQIVVIDSGTVIEKGTHKELMEKQGTYYSLRERLFDS